MVPLGLLECGESGEVVEIRGGKGPRETSCPVRGGTENVCFGRVADLGFRPGKNVEMLSNEGRGPVLVKVGESRIAMGRGAAMKIMVRRVE
jgi:ferrous iron transport protein A